jgi:hypothetical protein
MNFGVDLSGGISIADPKSPKPAHLNNRSVHCQVPLSYFQVYIIRPSTIRPLEGGPKALFDRLIQYVNRDLNRHMFPHSCSASRIKNMKDKKDSHQSTLDAVHEYTVSLERNQRDVGNLHVT